VVCTANGRHCKTRRELGRMFLFASCLPTSFYRLCDTVPVFIGIIGLSCCALFITYVGWNKKVFYCVLVSRELSLFKLKWLAHFFVKSRCEYLPHFHYEDIFTYLFGVMNTKNKCSGSEIKNCGSGSWKWKSRISDLDPDPVSDPSPRRIWWKIS